MGRRRIWIIVGTVLALVGIVLSLAIRRARVPFRFLEGRTPESKEDRSDIGMITEIYTWNEDATAVLDRARPELFEKGFVERPTGLFKRADIDLHIGSSSNDKDVDVVVILKKPLRPEGEGREIVVSRKLYFEEPLH